MREFLAPAAALLIGFLSCVVIDEEYTIPDKLARKEGQITDLRAQLTAARAEADGWRREALRQGVVVHDPNAIPAVFPPLPVR